MHLAAFRARGQVALAALWWMVVLLTSGPAQAGDPRLRWYTVETPHFLVHFHSGLEGHAQRVASLAEQIQRRQIPETGWSPRQRTQIVLSDDLDSANGFARAIPYNLVHLYVAAPDDMTAFDHYDEWLPLLLTHENTHVLHLDNAGGLSRLLNAVFGKSYVPNQSQPKWIIEGWAVHLESKLTGGGRLRSPHFDMFLRADVLEDNMARLDQISNLPLRWPNENLWYLYGGRFIEWIENTYGEGTLAAISADYGRNIMVWGINRSVRRTTGFTYPELWPAWVASLKRRYGEQVEAIQRRGLRQGHQLTRHGRNTANPLFAPSWRTPSDSAERSSSLGAVHQIVYFTDDGHTPGGIHSLTLSEQGVPLTSPQRITRSSGSQTTFDGQGALVFDSVAPSRRRYPFSDLFRLPSNQRAPGGNELRRKRLTVGRRARTPDVSPSGLQIVYVTNRAGTTTLRIADYDASGEISNERTLAPSAPAEQAFSPRFSPDGKWVAYSSWTAGGYRDIRRVEVATGKIDILLHDRAVEQQPCWGSDGRTLYFSSDRSGISNIYAFDISTRKLWQITNVVNGAFMPSVSPDGKLLVYVGYHTRGFDLYAMRLDRSQWLPALPFEDPYPSPQPAVPTESYPIRAYNPLGTLRPHNYSLQLGRGTFGEAASFQIMGEDASGNHGFGASLQLEAGHGISSMSLDYSYRRLPFTYDLSGFRRDMPRSGYTYGEKDISFVERATGLTSGITIPLNQEFQTQQASLSYTVMDFEGDIPVGTTATPWSLLSAEPHRGFFASLHLGYLYSNAQSFNYSVGPERGIALSLGTDVAGPELGSQSTLVSALARMRGYLPLPWVRHHVLAGALSGGMASGSYPRHGFYYAGGFMGSDLLSSVRSGATESSFVLRGYAPGKFKGQQFVLGNAEYRFPILRPDRGISTLPIYIRTLAGALFVDGGGAFDTLDSRNPWNSIHFGFGAELWAQLIFGYTAKLDLRLGYARGTDRHADSAGQVYAVLATAF